VQHGKPIFEVTAYGRPEPGWDGEPALDIWVGFVPDESAPTTYQKLSQIHDLLRTKGLDQVDQIFMHGQFGYQLPPHVKPQKHSSDAYLSITR